MSLVLPAPKVQDDVEMEPEKPKEGEALGFVEDVAPAPSTEEEAPAAPGAKKQLKRRNQALYAQEDEDA